MRVSAPLSRDQAALLKRFGASVRRERVRQKLTQEQLAERRRFFPRTVQKIEAGTTNVPLTTLARVRGGAAVRADGVAGQGGDGGRHVSPGPLPHGKMTP